MRGSGFSQPANSRYEGRAGLPARLAGLAHVAAVVVAVASASAAAAARGAGGAVAAAGGALRPGPGLVDVERTTAQAAAVGAGDGRFGFFVIGHLDEGEAARAAGFAVHHDADARDRSIVFE